MIEHHIQDKVNWCVPSPLWNIQEHNLDVPRLATSRNFKYGQNYQSLPIERARKVGSYCSHIRASVITRKIQPTDEVLYGTPRKTLCILFSLRDKEDSRIY